MSTDYHTDFNSSAYLANLDNPSNPTNRLFLLRCYHEAIQSFSNGLRGLDYGSGPSYFSTISVATKASEIVLSDYTESNLKALRQWLNKDPDAFDWSPYFSHVVQKLEGKAEEEVEKRQELVREMVKAVVPCDLTQDPPIEGGYDKTYDVVLSSLCVCSASQTSKDYLQGIAKLGKLVKPGGTLLIYEPEMTKCGQDVYYFGDSSFEYFGATSDFMMKSLKDSGFVDVSLKRCSLDARFKKKLPNRLGYIFLQGKKDI